MPHPYVQDLIALNMCFLAERENAKNSLFTFQDTINKLNRKIIATDDLIAGIETDYCPSNLLEILVECEELRAIYYRLISQECSLDEDIKVKLANAVLTMDNKSHVKTDLHRMAEEGHVNELRLILSKGEYASPSDEIGLTPLHYANTIEIAFELLRNGANTYYSSEAIRIKTERVLSGVDATIKLLCYIDNIHDDFDEDAIGDYITTREYNAALCLISVLLYNNIVPKNIRHEIRSGKLSQLYQRLLNSDLPANIKASLREYERDVPVLSEQHMVVHGLLLKFNAAIRLSGAARKNALTAFFSLPNVHLAVDVSGNGPLHFAAHENFSEGVKILLNNSNIKINSRNIQGNTALHIAAANDGSSVINILLVHEFINVNARNKRGQTPLHLAARSQEKNAITALLPRTDALTFVRFYGDMISPLYMAACMREKETVRTMITMLLAVNYPVNRPDSVGFTLMNYAAYCGDKESVLLLKRKGGVASLNAVNLSIVPPLFYAQDIDFVDFMMANGATADLDLTQVSCVIELEKQIAYFESDDTPSFDEEEDIIFPNKNNKEFNLVLQLIRYMFVINSEMQVEKNKHQKNWKQKQLELATAIFKLICTRSELQHFPYDKALVSSRSRLGKIYHAFFDTEFSLRFDNTFRDILSSMVGPVAEPKRETINIQWPLFFGPPNEHSYPYIDLPDDSPPTVRGTDSLFQL